MSVTITYRCTGCDAGVTVPVEVTVQSDPIGGGLVRRWYEWPTIPAAAPDGWSAADPWTAVTYCPACMAEIEATS